MPLLRAFDNPPFYAVKEVIEFVHRTLEGTNFMHDHHVAHRDLAYHNIMMDGTALYPKGFHPDRPERSRSATHIIKGRYRLHSPPVSYYFIDFDLSSKYEDDEPPVGWAMDGRDRDAPELQKHWTGPYDPFALDIFTLGNVYKKALLAKYDNLEFLRPLVDRITQISPKDRPSISEAMALFEPIYTARDRLRFRRRLHPFHEDRTTRYFQDVVAFNRDLGYMFCYSATYCYRLLTLQRPWKR